MKRSKCADKHTDLWGIRPAWSIHTCSGTLPLLPNQGQHKQDRCLGDIMRHFYAWTHSTLKAHDAARIWKSRVRILSPMCGLCSNYRCSEDAIGFVFLLLSQQSLRCAPSVLTLEGNMRRVADILLLLLVDILIAHNLHELAGEAIFKNWLWKFQNNSTDTLRNQVFQI